MAIKFIDKWRKSSRPIRYCILFILVHWAILYPLAAAIDGHPPIFLMIVEFPAIASLNIFYLIFPSSIRPFIADKIVIIETMIGITATTISYGLGGYLIGYWLNRHRRKA